MNSTSVTQRAAELQLAFILFVFIGIVFWRNGEGIAFTFAMQMGGLLTSGLILAIGLLAAFAWQTWFDVFHRFFFVSGSWLFSYRDTLIRLFPLEFWYDATMTISVLNFITGLLLALLGWRGQMLITGHPLHVLPVD